MVNTIRSSYHSVEANNAAQTPEQKLDIYKSFHVGQDNGSALQHWLTDTQRAPRAEALQSDQATHSLSGRPGVPPLKLVAGLSRRRVPLSRTSAT